MKGIFLRRMAETGCTSLPLQGPIRQIDHLIIAIRSVHPADQMVGCYEERAGSGKR
jgi:hypothetical protein